MRSLVNEYPHLRCHRYNLSENENAQREAGAFPIELGHFNRKPFVAPNARPR